MTCSSRRKCRFDSIGRLIRILGTILVAFSGNDQQPQPIVHARIHAAPSASPTGYEQAGAYQQRYLIGHHDDKNTTMSTKHTGKVSSRESSDETEEVGEERSLLSLSVQSRQSPDGVNLFVWPDNPPNVTLLGPCEGDCDDDSDCEPGLFCFNKPETLTNIPGCVGFDDTRTDYCIPIPTSTPTTPQTPAPSKSSVISSTPSPMTLPLPSLFVDLNNPPNRTLGVCEGDCDLDAECGPGLICYRRELYGRKNDTSIPGCQGYDRTRTDYCVLPSALEDVGITLLSTPSPSSTTNSTPPVMTPSQVSSGPTLAPSNPTTTQPLGPAPTVAPTAVPTVAPSVVPTVAPSSKQSDNPTPSTVVESERPSLSPSSESTVATAVPTPVFTGMPSIQPNIQEPTTIAPSGAGTTIGTGVPTDDLAIVRVSIFLDPWPEETSWLIADFETATSVISIPAGTYFVGEDRADVDVLVPAGRNYGFIVEDSRNDGIAGIGTVYQIVLVPNTSGDEIEDWMILLEGDGAFTSSRSETFYVPRQDEYPTTAPASPTVSPAPTVFKVPIYLTITFDVWHQETSWSIVRTDDPTDVLIDRPYDTYRSGDAVTEEIFLEPGIVVTFAIRDFYKDGINSGGYVMKASDGTVLFEGNGDFGEERSHEFVVPQS